MSICADYAEQMLDYLYGLLDEPDAQLLRDHLAGCPACQLALAQAKVQQNLIARAARKYSEVPMFEAPADESTAIAEPGRILQTPAAKQNQSSSPVILPLPVRRRKSWRRWAAVGAAAALLFAVGTLYANHLSTLKSQEKSLADARKEVEAIDAKLVSLNRDFEKEYAAIPAKVQERFLQVNVVGPVTYQPGAANNYRVATLTPAGKPAPANVNVKLLNRDGKAQSEQVLMNQDQQSSGELQFALPANLAVQAGDKARLAIEVSNSSTKEVIEQPLTIEPPSYLTHLALNKSTFRPGETLFFRTVTLERFALTPVAQPLTLACKLCRVVGGALVTVTELECTTQKGGIAGGEMALLDKLELGDYLFVVTDSAAAGNASNVRPVTRHVVLERPEQPKIIAGGGGAKLGGGKGGGGAKKGDVPAGPPSLSPVAEFFPEGGDLIAGALHRVYFRLNVPIGMAKNIEAFVEDSKNQDVLKIEEFTATGNHLSGSFTFTPHFGEVYKLRLAMPGKALDRWPLPKVLAGGVSLTAPQTVLPAGKPLTLSIRNTQREPVLLLVTCRGQTVDQRIVEVTDKLSDVTLEPLPGSHGILRVTAYEKDGQDWRPAAERLVYRQPASYLKLTPKFDGADGKDFKPGSHVNLGIESRDEKGASAATWMNALVIEEKALKGDHEASPPAFFFLSSELRDPEELEDADFLLADSPAAAKALDLFLGTQGWRRFVPQQAAPAPTNLIANNVQPQQGQPALFAAGNQTKAVLSRYNSAVQEQQDVLARQADQQRNELRASRNNAAASAVAAAAALAEQEQQLMVWLRFGVALAMLFLIVLGAVLLLLGLIVALLGRSSPRMMLASSCGVLLAAVVLFLSTDAMRMKTEEDIDPFQSRLAGLIGRDGPAPGLWEPNRFAEKALNDVAAPAGITNNLYAAAAFKEVRSENKNADLSVTESAMKRMSKAQDAKKAALFGAAKAGGGAAGGFGGGAGGKKGVGPATQSDQIGPKQLQALPQPQAAAADLAKGMALKQNTLRQFANSNGQTFLNQPEMLLWHPDLFAADGNAAAAFDLPNKSATYRVVIYGHTDNGRLGVYQGKLEAK